MQSTDWLACSVCCCVVCFCHHVMVLTSLPSTIAHCKVLSALQFCKLLCDTSSAKLLPQISLLPQQTASLFLDKDSKSLKTAMLLCKCFKHIYTFCTSVHGLHFTSPESSSCCHLKHGNLQIHFTLIQMESVGPC